MVESTGNAHQIVSIFQMNEIKVKMPYSLKKILAEYY